MVADLNMPALSDKCLSGMFHIMHSELAKYNRYVLQYVIIGCIHTFVVVTIYKVQACTQSEVQENCVHMQCIRSWFDRMHEEGTSKNACALIMWFNTSYYSYITVGISLIDLVQLINEPCTPGEH